MDDIEPAGDRKSEVRQEDEEKEKPRFSIQGKSGIGSGKGGEDHSPDIQ